MIDITRCPLTLILTKTQIILSNTKSFENDRRVCLNSELVTFLDMVGTDWHLRPYAHMKEKRILSFNRLNEESKTDDVCTSSLA